MIPLPAPNDICRPYRGVSVQEVSVPLEPSAVRDLLESREVYRRTDYLVLRSGEQTALAAVRRAGEEALFTPVLEARLLAGPDETAWVHAPEIDTGNATALAGAARDHPVEARVYVVEGRYEHVNFIWEPDPIPVRIRDVIPPEPPKLMSMAEQVVRFDEDLPPLDLVADTVDIREVAAGHPARRYLLPCRGSGVQLEAPVDFLDTRPPDREDWLLIGCERSRQFHRHFYGDDADNIDVCPRERPTDGPGSILSKCCLLERGVEIEGEAAVVPWGANLDEVRSALRRLMGLGVRQGDEAA